MAKTRSLRQGICELQVNPAQISLVHAALFNNSDTVQRVSEQNPDIQKVTGANILSLDIDLAIELTKTEYKKAVRDNILRFPVVLEPFRIQIDDFDETSQQIKLLHQEHNLQRPTDLYHQHLEH
jgi:hypothetical protein